MEKTIIAGILALSILMSFAVVSYAEDETTVKPEVTVAVTEEDKTTAITDEKTSEAVSESTDTDTTFEDADGSESVTIINAVLMENDGKESAASATDEVSIPDTGDNSKLAPAVIVLVVSAAFIALLVIKRKKAPEKADKKDAEDNEDKE